MKFIYANFSDSAVNYGNHIIDYATKLLLNEYLPIPFDEFDSLKSKAPLRGDYEFALIPGCTLLTPGQAGSLNLLRDLNTPIFCLAGSIWAPIKPRGFLLGHRVFRFGKEYEPDLSVVRMCAEPVGCRDPYTYEKVTRAGIKANYMGCPTLMLPNHGVADDGYLLFSFGRDRLRSQVKYARSLAGQMNVVGICHQIHDYDKIRAAGWNFPLVDYHGDLEAYLSYFKRASIVVTGRLHGALPSLAYGKRLFYFGTKDSRTTILDDLGIPIYGYSDIPKAFQAASEAFNRSIIETFRRNWQTQLQMIVERFKSSNNNSSEVLATINH